eukprot:TRINITY_DN1413_c0_g1_i3.p2 TRINITY_DN1413_c0_g1~~TRINITY_DN1413_c0_g1_i3.p2  ORF type:complete len:100 (-),score=16.31 TRINITY_DN1413_c0_g1_i3:393-692(-)
MSYMNPTAFPAMLELLTSPPHEIDMLLEDSWGRTALHVAAEYGNDVAVETLLDRGADKLAEDHVSVWCVVGECVCAESKDCVSVCCGCGGWHLHVASDG